MKISTPLLLGTLALFAVALALALPPIPQPASYHAFADSRTWLGIPNFWNLASNLPFLVVGLVGLLGFKRDFPSGMSQGLAPIYLVFYAAIALTALGSTYYHAGPDNAALTWDRLPMAIAFMSVLQPLHGPVVAADRRLDDRLPRRLVEHARRPTDAARQYTSHAHSRSSVARSAASRSAP